MTQRNKLNWKLRPFLAAPINSQAAAFLMLRAQQRWQSKSQEGLLHLSRSISFFRTASNIFCLPLLVGLHAWQQPYYITKVCPWDVWEGHRLPSTLTFFLQKIFARSTSLFYLYLHLKPSEKCFFFFFRRRVAWSWHNIQRSTVSCILFPWLRGKVSGARSL